MKKPHDIDEEMEFNRDILTMVLNEFNDFTMIDRFPTIFLIPHNKKVYSIEKLIDLMTVSKLFKDVIFTLRPLWLKLFNNNLFFLNNDISKYDGIHLNLFIHIVITDNIIRVASKNMKHGKNFEKKLPFNDNDRYIIYQSYQYKKWTNVEPKIRKNLTNYESYTKKLDRYLSIFNDSVKIKKINIK